MFVVGDRPESIEAEPNNTVEQAGAISVNTVIQGEINGGADVDCFRLEGKKGQRLFLDLKGERIESRLDATIRIMTPGLTELAESRDVFGLDPFLDVTLPEDGRYVIKVHDAIYGGSPDHFYRLTVHDGPHLDAIVPAAVGPGAPLSMTLIGRGLGAGAVADRAVKSEGRVFERLSLPDALRDAALLAREPFGPARSFVPPSAAGLRRGVDYSQVRVSADGTIPVVSNSLFVGRAVDPVVLEQEPNDDLARAQKVGRRATLRGHSGPRATTTFFSSRAERVRSGGWKRWPSGLAQWPTPPF